MCTHWPERDLLCKPKSLVKQKHSRTYLLPRSSMQSTLVSCCQSIYFLLSSVLDTPGYPSESIVDTITNYCSKRRLAVSVVCIFDSLALKYIFSGQAILHIIILILRRLDKNIYQGNDIRKNQYQCMFYHWQSMFNRGGARFCIFE